MNKICPLFKMAIMISNKAFGGEDKQCIGDACQWWDKCQDTSITISSGNPPIIPHYVNDTIMKHIKSRNEYPDGTTGD